MPGQLRGRHGPALFASLLNAAVTLWLARDITQQTGGLFVYPLDDSYIHLALARNLAAHGGWGLRAGAFASASSSPGWTLLLALCDLCFGPRLVTPVVLNLLLASGALFAADDALRRAAPTAPASLRTLALLSLVFVTPLPGLGLLGMEHAAQTLSVLLLVSFAARALASPRDAPVPRRVEVGLLLAAAFAGAVRYEAAFAVAPAVALFAARRRAALALRLALCASVGPVGFALFSYAQCGLLLPFSVLSKAAQQHATVLQRVRGAPDFLLSLPAALLAAWAARFRTARFWEPVQLTLLLTAATALGHVAVAPVGWLMRYESYLVLPSVLSLWLAAVTVEATPLGAVTVSLSLGGPALAHATVEGSLWSALRRLPRWPTGLAVAALLVVAWSSPDLYARARRGLTLAPLAAVDRYREHVQIARFVGRYYDRATVAVNDIGAVAYYTRAELLDLAGLGSVEPHLIRQRGVADPAGAVGAWVAARRARVAVLQSQWEVAARLTPASWRLVATWHLPRNVVFDTKRVAFYAVVPDEAPRLCAALRGFRPPAAVRVEYADCPAR